MAVRYDKKFNNEISRIVAAYNRKITRLSKTEHDYILPQRFTRENIKEMKRIYVSRTDVRRRLKELQRFTAKGGELNVKVNGVNIPKYQYQNIKRYQRLLKSKTDRRLREFETRKPMLNGEIQPFTFAQYGTQEYLTLKAKREKLLEKDISALTYTERQNYLDSLRANTKTVDLDLWNRNFLDIFEDTALTFGYNKEKLSIIMDLLRKLTPEQIDDLTFINSNIKDVIYGYKKVTDIKSFKDLEKVGSDVRSNMDEILSNITTNLKDYLSEDDFKEVFKKYKTDDYNDIINNLLTEEEVYYE